MSASSTDRSSFRVSGKLFAFPHAGGADSVYRSWTAKLPTEIDLIPISLPGRGTRESEKLISEWPALVEAVIEVVLANLDGAPFAFFGHSFGALLAFEVARALRDRNAPVPSCLFLSAHRAAHIPSHNCAADQQTHALPEDRFGEIAQAWGLLPDEVVANAELRALVYPALRNDLRLDELYVFTKSEPLDVNCFVFGGDEDRSVSNNELTAWQQHFRPERQFAVQTFAGGHFYTLDQEDRVLASLLHYLDATLSAGEVSVLRPAPREAMPFASIWREFVERAQMTPHALALDDEDRSWTFASLRSEAELLASRLATMGVGKGDVVGLFMPHCAEHLIALLAVFARGAVACLLEKSWSDVLLDEFLASCEVRTIVTLPDLAVRIPERLCTGILELAPNWPQAFRAIPGTWPAVSDVSVAAEDIAFISMTSGSTGKPKAVLTSHAGCYFCFHARFDLYPYAQDEREGVNVFFAWECLRPLLRGHPSVIIADSVIFDPPRLAKLIEEKRITRLVTTPSLLESVLDHPGLAAGLPARLRHMTAWLLMGEVTLARVVEKAARAFPPHVKLVNIYSTWECLDVAYADLLPSEVRPYAIAGGSSPLWMRRCAARRERQASSARRDWRIVRSRPGSSSWLS